MSYDEFTDSVNISRSIIAEARELREKSTYLRHEAREYRIEMAKVREQLRDRSAVEAPKGDLSI